MRTLSDKSSENQIGDHILRHGEGGCLTEPEDRTMGVAERISDKEGFSLGEDHRAVINFTRACSAG
jgi:sulfur relay (sulfurtransferase) DsrC/TusE family protein